MKTLDVLKEVSGFEALIIVVKSSLAKMLAIRRVNSESRVIYMNVVTL